MSSDKAASRALHPFEWGLSSHGECLPVSLGLSQAKLVCQKWHLCFSSAESLKGEWTFHLRDIWGSERDWRAHSAFCPPPWKVSVGAVSRLSFRQWTQGDVNAFQPKCPQILNSIWCNFLLFAAASLTSLAVNAVLSVPFLLSRSVSGKLLKLIYAKRINVWKQFQMCLFRGTLCGHAACVCSWSPICCVV